MRGAIEIDGLSDALAAGPPSVISLVGGGGKTTALFALGDQLEGRVVLTTTTKMGSDRHDGHTPLLDPSDDDLEAVLDRDGVALVWAGIDGHRAVGIDPETVGRWWGLADHIVIEADGSRRRPFKAPADHEPVVPAATTMLIGCVGAAAFDGVIAEVCHRPELVADLVGCETSDTLTAPRLASVLTHPGGTMKQRPDTARYVVMLNQLEEEHADFADAIEAAIGDTAEVVRVARFRPTDR